MFPAASSFEIIGEKARHTFQPAPKPVTVERELRRVCGQWQANWDERFSDESSGGEQVEPKRPVITTIGDLFDQRWEARKLEVSQITTDRDRYKLKLFRRELGEAQPLSSLTQEHLQGALLRIAKNVSAKTANAAFRTVKTYLTWAANAGLLRDHSHKNVHYAKVPPTARHQRPWWTWKEVELAIRCAEQDPHQPTATLLVACGCYLGLRPEEIIMLRWQDFSLDAVDLDGRPIPVCHITPHDGWTPKDNELRDIPIRRELHSILLKYRRASGFLLNPMVGPNTGRALPGRPRGGGHGLDYRFDPKKVWARIISRVEAAGGRRITMYSMRHTFASNQLMEGKSDSKVAHWLGHSDTRMVHRHYGHFLSYDDDINAPMPRVQESGSSGAR
jgi:integrase